MVSQANDFSLAVLGQNGSPAVRTAGFEKYAAVDGVGGTGRSLEFWISLQALPSSIASIVGDGEGATRFRLHALPDGRWPPAHIPPDDAEQQPGDHVGADSATLEINQVTHVVATWEQASGEIFVYLDGQPAVTTPVDGTLPNTGSPRNTTNAMFVGRDNRNTANLQATIDEVAVYNYAIGGAGRHALCQPA